MATKLGRMIASLDGLLPIMSHDPLITWPCEIGGSLTGGGSAPKCLSRHRLLVLIEWTFYCFVMCKCMSSTVCVDGTVEFTFFLVIRLNITIVTSCDSLIVIFLP